MYALAEKFVDTKVFVVQCAGDAVHDYTTFESAVGAWEESEQFEGWVKERIADGGALEDARAEFLDTITEYSADEVLQKAEDGYSWPIDMGFVVEV